MGRYLDRNAGPNIVIGRSKPAIFAGSYPYPFYDAFAIGIAAGSGLLIQGNKIGTKWRAWPGYSTAAGIYIDDATGFLIGGTAAGAGNLISGSVFSAITINGTSGGTIEGNDIGTRTAAIRTPSEAPRSFSATARRTSRLAGLRPLLAMSSAATMGAAS